MFIKAEIIPGQYFGTRKLLTDIRTKERNISYTYSSVQFQLDAQVTEFILSDNCSTCFGRHYHPSSGAQNNCSYSIW